MADNQPLIDLASHSFVATKVQLKYHILIQ